MKEPVETVYGEKALKKITIYAIIKKVKNGETTDDQSHLNGNNQSRSQLSLPLLALLSMKTTS
jgi:hypothetical protein